MPSSSRAGARPSVASCCRRVGRIFTNANSNATKNALASTTTTLRTMASEGLMDVGRASRSKVVEAVPGDGQDVGGQRLGGDQELAGRARPAPALRRRDGG